MAFFTVRKQTRFCVHDARRTYYHVIFDRALNSYQFEQYEDQKLPNTLMFNKIKDWVSYVEIVELYI